MNAEITEINKELFREARLIIKDALGSFSNTHVSVYQLVNAIFPTLNELEKIKIMIFLALMIEEDSKPYYIR